MASRKTDVQHSRIPGSGERLFNHAATIAFTVENDREDGILTKDEIIHGVLRRLALLMENPGEFSECAEVYDTYAIDMEEF